MLPKRPLLPKEVPPAVATFLSFCGDVVVAKLPNARLATMLNEGKLTLLLGDCYLEADDEQRADDLKHEVGHFVLGHIPRCGERDKYKFNLVCDASLAFQGINKTLESDSTFDKLPCKHGGTIPPCPPEAAYELLADPPSLTICGSFAHSSADKSPASEAKMAIIGATIKIKHPELLKALGATLGGSEVGTGRPIPEIPPQPPWIRNV